MINYDDIKAPIDRVPEVGKEGYRKLTDIETGTAKTYKVEYADNPTEEGTIQDKGYIEATRGANRKYVEASGIAGSIVQYVDGEWVKSQRGTHYAEYEYTRNNITYTCLVSCGSARIDNADAGYNYYARQFSDLPNKVSNPQFEDGTDYWYAVRGSLSALDNIMNHTGDGMSPNGYAVQITSTSVDTSHLYYIMTRLRVTNDKCIEICVEWDGSDGGTNKKVARLMNPNANEWCLLSDVATPPSDADGNFKLLLIHGYASSTDQLDSVMEVDGTKYNGVLLVDLTEEYGAGNEPTKEECDIIYGRNISTGITDYKIGQAISENVLLVNIQGDYGLDEAYTDDMTKYLVLPGRDGTTRHRLVPNTTLDGAMIRSKSSPWETGDDENTGALIANITDFSNYMGNNDWYTTSGETNGDTNYYKCFPYVGDNFNKTIGHNEAVATVGGLRTEYIYEVSGTTLLDVSGNGNNATNSNVTLVTGEIGNAGSYNGSNSYTIGNSKFLTPTQLDNDFSISIRIRPESTGFAGLISFYSQKFVSLSWESNSKVRFRMYNSSTDANVYSPVLSLNEWHHIIITRSKTDGIKMYVDGNLVDSNSFIGNADSRGYSDTIGSTNGTGYNYHGDIDNVSFLTRLLSEEEVDTFNELGDAA